MNFPYRGHKGMLFEGGIRVPFCVSWPSRIPEGQTLDEPVTGLDVFPTALAAAGIEPPDRLALDGENLLPYLTGKTETLPPRSLVWRYATGPDEFGYAVRDGAWKPVSSRYKGRQLLFNLEADPYEQHDLVEAKPEIAHRLSGIYDRWASQMHSPLWLDPHGANVRKEEAERQRIVEGASRGEKAR